jgi:2-iminobutanoate/2-iminopropanoate deaminase
VPKRQSIEIPGVTHGNTPIPMGARIGQFVCSSGIAGKDPETDTLPPDAALQAEFMFRNLAGFMVLAGGTPENILRLTIYAKDLSYREYINTAWLKMFPDEQSRPARHIIKYDLPGGMLVQCEVMAVLGT